MKPETRIIKEYLSQIGSIGGRSKSKAKKLAGRKNAAHATKIRMQKKNEKGC